MSKSIIEEIRNIRKEQMIKRLKEDGKFVDCCKEFGFIYNIVQKIKGKEMHLTIGLKAGKFHIVDVKHS